ncbi:MAG: hypothetical protein HGA23_10890 [Bacteroidales bacterium]|nr:hypothetical protein [Bacteroidales bacterium]
MKYEDFLVSTLGKGNVISPLKQSQRPDSPVYKFVKDDERTGCFVWSVRKLPGTKDISG